MTAIYLLTGIRPQDFESNPHTSELIWQADAPATSPDLVDILNKAISFNPRDRFQTAGEFLAVLQGINQSAATQVLMAPTMPATEIVALSAASNTSKPAAIPKNLLLIGGIFAATAFSAIMLLRPQEPKVAVVPAPSTSPPSSVSIPGEPLNVTPSSAIQVPTPQSIDPSSVPTNNSAPKNNIKPSCNYYAGEAVTGQTVNLDLCSITTNNSDKVGFVYYLGGKQMGSAANCSNNTWRNFSDQQVHRPLSSATQRMLESVCSRRQVGIPKSNDFNSEVVKATIFIPPINIRESPDVKTLCVINKKITINTYGVNKSWYKTDVCGSMGVVHSEQLNF
jgi:serine/threonine protein kinase